MILPRIVLSPSASRVAHSIDDGACCQVVQHNTERDPWPQHSVSVACAAGDTTACAPLHSW